MSTRKPFLVIGHLYPDLMNLYGDRGNIICLVQRCRWRGIEVEVRSIGLGEPLPTDCDLVFMGGGQDKEQRTVAQDLREVKGEALRREVEKGLVALTVCGGYQLFARYYRPMEGPDLEGLGIFDAWTVHRGGAWRRCIGNVLVEWNGHTLVGFENHGGRTYLGPDAKPLGRVLLGYGNNAEDKGEGAVYRNIYGTYLHGSFLPKNPRFADHLLWLALQRKWPGMELPALDDSLEMRAHRTAIQRVRRRASLEGRLQAWLWG